MTPETLQVGSLVVYKTVPAKVLDTGDKLEIGFADGKSKRVRPKDIRFLHPGPVVGLRELGALHGDPLTAWELLAGSETQLPELAELIFEAYSPATAWQTWQWVAQGLYFQGEPDCIQARSREDVAETLRAKEAKVVAEREWQTFMAHLDAGELTDDDRARLVEVERVALEQLAVSRILQQRGHDSTPQQAYRFLVACGYWPGSFNPHPGRLGVDLRIPDLELVLQDDLPRVDLTHLPAFAIDDEGNQDPDDAVSLDGDDLWVHVADVAAWVPPDSPADQEARSRGSNFYRPEGVVPMLPPAVTTALGLGLESRSPALSFHLRLDADDRPALLEVVPSWLSVTRLTYEAVEQQFMQAPFARMLELAQAYRRRRDNHHAVDLELPEVSIKVVDGQVQIRALPRLSSRELVTNLMLMAGEAIAHYCRERDIPIPLVSQPEPDTIERPRTLSAMYAYRRKLKPSRLGLEPLPHFGLGLPLYTRATSPLRRYSDLLVHQQLRAHLGGRPLLDAAVLAQRIDLSETGSLGIRRAERLSNHHWKLVYLQSQSQWKGQGVVVDQGENQKATVLIPELALETRIRLQRMPELDSPLRLACREIDLPLLEAYFRALG